MKGGWRYMHVDPRDGLYHGFHRNHGEFTVTPQLVQADYYHRLNYFAAEGYTSTPYNLHITEEVVRRAALLCGHWSRRVGQTGIEWYSAPPQEEVKISNLAA